MYASIRLSVFGMTNCDASVERTDVREVSVRRTYDVSLERSTRRTDAKARANPLGFSRRQSNPDPVHRHAPICRCVPAFSGRRGQRPSAQARKKPFSHADTLRGSNGPGRSWWDAASTICTSRQSRRQQHPRLQRDHLSRAARRRRRCRSTFRSRSSSTASSRTDSALQFRRDGNAFFVALTAPQTRRRAENDRRLLPRQAAAPRSVRRGTAD